MKPDRAHLRRRIVSHAAAQALLLLTTACATTTVAPLFQVSNLQATYHVPGDLGISSCRDSLDSAVPGDGARLDPYDIRLANWNIRKNSSPDWLRDYDQLAAGRDLILIQEASLRPDTITDLTPDMHWSFAPGYRTSGEVTGVLTLSSRKPLTQCSFVTMEPLMRTPKGTSLTQYGLAGTEQTLVVVNVHAVSLSFGLDVFEQQFAQIAAALENHTGPVILSGDLNTWRHGRMAIIDNLAATLSLEPLSFSEDHRMRVMGRFLDHIYVRGLTALQSNTRMVSTSDHRPMSVTLTM